MSIQSSEIEWFKGAWEAAELPVGVIAKKIDRSVSGTHALAKRLKLTSRPLRIMKKILARFEPKLSEERLGELALFLDEQSYRTGVSYRVSYGIVPWYIYFYLQRSCSSVISYGEFTKYLEDEGFHDCKPKVQLRAKQAILTHFGNTCTIKRQMLKLFKDLNKNYPIMITSVVKDEIERVIKKNSWVGSPRSNLGCLVYHITRKCRGVVLKNPWFSTEQIATALKCHRTAMMGKTDSVTSKIREVLGEAWFQDVAYHKRTFFRKYFKKLWGNMEIPLSEIAEVFNHSPRHLYDRARRGSLLVLPRILMDMIHQFDLKDVSTELHQKISLSLYNQKNYLKIYWYFFYCASFLEHQDHGIPLLKFRDYLKSHGYSDWGSSMRFQRQMRDFLASSNLFDADTIKKIHKKIIVFILIYIFQGPHYDSSM